MQGELLVEICFQLQQELKHQTPQAKVLQTVLMCILDKNP